MSPPSMTRIPPEHADGLPGLRGTLGFLLTKKGV